MSKCKSYDYPGWGESALASGMWFTQAIRVGSRIHCSGQGGWDGPSVQLADLKEGTNLIHPDLSSEIDHAFANCDLNLKHAGGKGFSQVYKIVTYSTDIKSQQEHISRNLRKWMPDHRATVTEIGVRELGLEGMHFEIEVEAYDPEGAAEAEK